MFVRIKLYSDCAKRAFNFCPIIAEFIREYEGHPERDNSSQA